VIRLVANRTIEVECGSTTYTRARDETVDFSINFFFTGTQLLVKRGSGIKNLADVAGKRVGVAHTTTGEKALLASQPKADVVTFQDHGAGFLALEQGRIVAYATDGVLLVGFAAKAKNPKDYEVVGNFFSKDPYSCMVPENDSKWRDFVNHTFMELIDNIHANSPYATSCDGSMKPLSSTNTLLPSATAAPRCASSIPG